MVKSGWVTRKKATGEVRARIVAQQVSDGSCKEEYFSPTPRLVAHRLVTGRAVQRGWRVHAGDVKAAFLHTPMQETPEERRAIGEELDTEEEEVYLRPPQTERPESKELQGEKNFLWRMQRWLHGLRKSPKKFNEHFAAKVKLVPWHRTSAEPQLYWSSKYKGALTSVHTDDLFLTAAEEHIAQIKKELGEQLTLKWSEPTRKRWQRFVGYEWKHEGDRVLMRAPQKYVANLLKEWRVDEAKAAPNPYSGMTRQAESQEPVDLAERKRFRRAIGQLMWMIPLRPDAAFTIKELARAASKPKPAHITALRRLLKYLRGAGGDVLEITGFKEEVSKGLTVYVDADWKAPRSTSGAVFLWNGVLIETGSKTQPVPALSSAEAEIISMNEVLVPHSRGDRTRHNASTYVVRQLKRHSLWKGERLRPSGALRAQRAMGATPG